jgi:hypothetical protein
MRLAYIIGPYRATSEHGVVENIRAAEAVAIELWRNGIAVLCPHKNTALLGGIVPDEVFLEGDVEMLKRCDFAVTLAGWEHSAGSKAEVALCKDRGIQVYQSAAMVRVYENGDMT